LEEREKFSREFEPISLKCELRRSPQRFSFSAFQLFTSAAIVASMTASTVAQYLAALPAERRAALSAVRKTINKNLPEGYEEGMQFGMIGWYIPLARYPETYNGQPLCMAALASQKGSNSLYLMTVYGDKTLDKRFRAGFKAAGKKLDMGKSCVRFKTADALALDVIGDAIAAIPVDMYIASYEKARAKTKSAKARTKKPAAKKPAAKKPAKRR
jgi:hypothetical protein